MTVSVKSLQKQLIAAVAMVLVAMIALGSSTYAWFVNNTTVEATGMSVSATTSEAIMISATGTDGTFKTSMALDAGKGELAPVTITDNGVSKSLTVATDTGITAAPKFYKLSTNNKVLDSTVADAQVKMSAAITGSTVAANFVEDTQNYVTDDVYLLYTGAAETKDVNMKIVATVANPVSIDKAMHIAIIDGAGVYKNYDVGSGTWDSGNKTYTVTVSGFTTLTKGTPAKYTAYIWYEGEDSDCTTKNAASVNSMSIAINFSTEAFT